MKANITRGNGFRGLANYILDKVKDAEYVGGNMISKTSKDLAKEFSVCRKLRPSVKRPAYHVSLALPTGERIDNSEWLNVAQAFLKKMGVDIEIHQYFIARHNDTDKDHIHIALNRIGFNSELYHGRNDVMLAINATHELEKEFGLTITPTFDPDNKAERKKLTRNEIQMSARTDEVPARLALQNILDEALTDKMNVFAFIERCESAGATVIPNIAKTGRLNGFAFEYDGIKFKGSDLGAKYTYKNLKELVIYEQDRQSKQLIEATQAIKQRLDAVNERDAGSEQSKPNADREDDKRNADISSEFEIDSKEPERTRNISQNSTPEEPRGSVESDIKDGKSRAGTQSTEQQHSDRNEDPLLADRLNDWRDADNYIDDIVAPLASSSSKNKSANILKKEAEWKRQAEALNCDKFRITLISRNGNSKLPWNLGKQKDSEERFFTANEVKEKIPLLSKKNAEGRDIYITPITDSYHYIVIDDLTPDSKRELLSNGYNPTLIQESSKDNYQAIFRVPKTGDKDDRQVANKIVVGLNRKYGDANFTGVSHPFRMAGFSNKKQGKNNYFTQLISTSVNACGRVITLLKQEFEKVVKEREEAAAIKAEKPRERTESLEQERLRLIASVDKNTKTSDAVFMKLWNRCYGLVQRNGWVVDYSRIDYSVTKDMIKNGYSDAEITSGIVNSSPSIASRKNDIYDYANRTIEKAKLEMSSKKPNNNNELSV